MAWHFFNEWLSFVFPFALLALMMLLVRRRLKPLSRVPRPKVEQCKCGYPLKDLTVSRCPECGCVLGFNATAEQLGLTVEQLERVHAVHELRERERLS